MSKRKIKNWSRKFLSGISRKKDSKAHEFQKRAKKWVKSNWNLRGGSLQGFEIPFFRQNFRWIPDSKKTKSLHRHVSWGPQRGPESRHTLHQFFPLTMRLRHFPTITHHAKNIYFSNFRLLFFKRGTSWRIWRQEGGKICAAGKSSVNFFSGKAFLQFVSLRPTSWFH